MPRPINVILLAVLMVGLAGCPTPPQTRTAEPAGPAARAEQPPTGAVVLPIDLQRSSVAIEVFRSGPLASMGHNHVVTAGEIAGRLWIHPQLERSGYALEVPVAMLIVDDEAARRAAGDAFPPGLSQEAKAATRSNMLGPAVLDADRYPVVRLRSVSVSGTPPQLATVAAITVRGATHEVTVPVTLDPEARPVAARGAFTLNQSDFGITPFSVALGALSVADEVRVRFELVAGQPRE
ncbi:MAG TPA: YceI family protein [Steroidobacteraceae bacterium]|nr:YceI family protein [Steroidobacteraceae bacterium]